jgi:hypothetical protein
VWGVSDSGWVAIGTLALAGGTLILGGVTLLVARRTGELAKQTRDLAVTTKADVSGQFRPIVIPWMYEVPGEGGKPSHWTWSEPVGKGRAFYFGNVGRGPALHLAATAGNPPIPVEVESSIVAMDRGTPGAWRKQANPNPDGGIPIYVSYQSVGGEKYEAQFTLRVDGDRAATVSHDWTRLASS